MKSLFARYLPLSVAVTLAGCSAVVENSRSVSDWVWHCETNAETGEWDCQRVRLENGRLPAHLNQPAARQIELVQPDNEPIEPPLEITPDSVIEPLVREVEDSIAPEPAVADETPLEAAEPELQREMVPKTALLQSQGFYLQLAAFAQQLAISRFIDEHQLTGDGLEQHYILSNGRYWHVLTAGHYSTRGDAVEAMEKLQREYSGIEPWVRSARSLQQAIEAAR